MCRWLYDCLRAIFNFLRNLCCCFAEDSEENGRLLTKSIHVTTSPLQAYCRNTFQNFQNKYLRSCNLEWKDLQVITNTVIILCPKKSRLQDDITETLNYFKILGQPKIMLIVLHYCERDIEPENLLTENRESRVSSFANIVYSDSEQCYDCHINGKAVKAIKDFIRSNWWNGHIMYYFIKMLTTHHTKEKQLHFIHYVSY